MPYAVPVSDDLPDGTAYDSLLNRYEDKVSHISELEAERAALLKKVAAKNEKIAVLRVQLEKARTKLMGLEEEHGDLKKGLDEALQAKTVAEDKSARLGALKQEHENTTRQLDTALQAKAVAEKECLDLRLSSVTSQHQLEHIHKKLSSLCAKTTMVEMPEIPPDQATPSSPTSIIGTHHNEPTSTTIQAPLTIAALLLNLEDLTTQSRATISVLKTTEADLKTTTSHLRTSQTERFTLTESLLAANKEVAHNASKIAALEEELEKLRKKSEKDDALLKENVELQGKILERSGMSQEEVARLLMEENE